MSRSLGVAPTSASLTNGSSDRDHERSYHSASILSGLLFAAFHNAFSVAEVQSTGNGSCRLSASMKDSRLLD